MFENTRWSNPNYDPRFDYAQRVEAARQGSPWYNFGVDAFNTLGKAGEGVMQKLFVKDILDRNLAGGGGSSTEVGNPSVQPLSKNEYQDILKKYYYNNAFGYTPPQPTLRQALASDYSFELLPYDYDFNYGV